MHEAVSAHLAAWEAFYIIVGSSAGALTGLQFVVMALVAEARQGSSRREVSAFGTPTVVHFCAVLLVGAILSAPWGSLSNVALAIGTLGLAGVAFSAIVVKRASTQGGYKPDLGDWAWHAALPLLAYSSLVLAAIALQRSLGSGLFVVGAAALVLLFIGIHNAWDSVTYIAVGQRESSKRHDKRSKPSHESTA